MGDGVDSYEHSARSLAAAPPGGRRPARTTDIAVERRGISAIPESNR